MCGIAGVISREPVDLPTLTRGADAMRHRGPDSRGIDRRGNASLIFQRLAIIDLSPSGNQPMCNENGDVWIVFNGEIYDFKHLRAELERNHQFRSKSDTEILIHGYEEWGLDGLLQRVHGMFAFAIWNERTQELSIARDRFGKKPLYYSQFDGGLAFASTLNTLLELLPSRPAIDPIAMDEYLIYQAVPAPRTIYRGVSMLRPAHCATWKLGAEFHERRYWRLSYADKKERSENDLLEELNTLLRNAVERRLVSDVPLGAFLSGGVDSSLIVSIMSDLGAGPVEAVVVGFDNPEFDERPYARAVAQKWKAHLHEHVMPSDEIQRLPKIVWHYGQPLADVSIVPTYAVARAAKEHVTVVLNGDGGDEAFAGYARPVVARASQAFRRMVPSMVRPAAAMLVRQAGKKGRMLAGAATRSAREAFIYDRGLRSLRRSLYSEQFMSELHPSDPDRHYADVWDSADGPTDADRALHGDLVSYLPDQLLTKMDVSTMAHSLEARSPLLDTHLVEFAATIPASQLTRNFRTKHLLKRLAERYVPREVIYRRKRGFVMPASTWLRRDLAGTVRSLLTSKTSNDRGLFRPDGVRTLVDEHESGRRDWGNQLWTLMVLEIWNRIFMDKTLDPDQPLAALSPDGR